ncbi:MAG: ScbR family autoregulator-binding transcription factor [Humibacter sp.]
MTQARAVARRDEIVRAAAAEFDEMGYAGASLSNIGARLGRTKGAMSYHFSSKASLAQEIAAHPHEQWDAVVSNIRDAGYSGIDAVVMLSFIVSRRFRDDVLIRAGIRLQHDAGLHGVDLPVPFVGWMEIVRAQLADNESSVKLPAGIDIDSAAEVLVEAFTGLQQVAHRLTKARDIHQRVSHFWLIMLPALGIEDAPERVVRLRTESDAY